MWLPNKHGRSFDGTLHIASNDRFHSRANPAFLEMSRVPLRLPHCSMSCHVHRKYAKFNANYWTLLIEINSCFRNPEKSYLVLQKIREGDQFHKVHQRIMVNNDDNQVFQSRLSKKFGFLKKDSISFKLSFLVHDSKKHEGQNWIKYSRTSQKCAIWNR